DGLHPRRVLGRDDNRARPAALDPGAVGAAAERRDLRRLPRRRAAASRRILRPQRGADVMGRRDKLTPQLLAIAVLAVIWIGLGFVVSNSYYQLILTLVPIWAAMGLSWNVLSGYTGLVSFGHASFFGLGAYTVTLAMTNWDVTPWLGIPLGTLVGV